MEVKTVRHISKVCECDLMENSIGTVEHDGSSFKFTIKPYEIKTFMIDFK